MTKTISDEEYERLIKRDAQVDECLEKFSGISGIQAKEFRKTAKPKQYRPTWDELVRVYCEVQGYDDAEEYSHSYWKGLKAVIDKVCQGMWEEYRKNDDRDLNKTFNKHWNGYKEE